MHLNRGRIEAIDVDEDITLVDMETEVNADELQGRLEEKDEVNVAAKEVNVVEPTVFDDEEVTMTMAQTLIKMKAEKARILDEQMAKRLHDEEVEQAAARERQERDDFKRAQELQQQYDQKQENIDWNVVAEHMQEKHLDNIRKYQSLNRKPIYVAQARKNMIVYSKNMVGYKIAHFKGMTYDQVRPIFEREYNKVQTFLKPDRDEEPTNKRGDNETLLQESFKKLRAEVEVSGSHSTQDTPIDDPKEMYEEYVKNMLQIVQVSELKVDALQKSRYRRGVIDKTLFIKQDKKDIMLVQVYVDDIIFGSIKKSWCDEFEELMKNRRLISWKCKKETIMVTSTTEAEYVAAAYYCGLVLWIHNQLLDYGFNIINTKIYIENESTICIMKNPVFHSKTKHIEIRHHFIRDAYEKKLIQVLKIHTDDIVADLLTKEFNVSSKELASPKQTALGKDKSHPFMACSLPKTK
nr:putative ribonuclease H-like domain-containing protein [Tanacetum cinerariifolium]